MRPQLEGAIKQIFYRQDILKHICIYRYLFILISLKNIYFIVFYKKKKEKGEKEEE